MSYKLLEKDDCEATQVYMELVGLCMCRFVFWVNFLSYLLNESVYWRMRLALLLLVNFIIRG